MKGAEYCRKSSEDKNKQILSLEDQVRECQKVVENNNVTLVHAPFIESRSAKKPGRPEFAKLIALIKTGGVDAIVCWDASRLCRNGIDGGQLIHLIDSGLLKAIFTPYTSYTQENSFMLWIEFGMSTDFIKKLSFNVKRALKGKAEKGIWPSGQSPLGYLNTPERLKGQRELIVDHAKFDLCRKWWDLQLSGKYNVEESLSKITALGLRGRNGESVSRTTAYRFFRNISYTGHFVYSGILYKGSHPAMITMSEFNRIQERLDRANKTTPTKQLAEFSGFIHCGECAAHITFETHTKTIKDGTIKTYNFYRCTKKLGACKQPFIPADELNKQAKALLESLRLETSYIEWVRGVLHRRNQQEFDFDRKQKELASKRLLDISKRKEIIFGMKTDGLISKDEYEAKKAEVLKEEAEAKEGFDNHSINRWEQILTKTLDFSARVMELFNHGDALTRKLVLQIVGSNLILKDKKLEIEAKSLFIFLKQDQTRHFGDNVRLEPENADTKANTDIFLNQSHFVPRAGLSSNHLYEILSSSESETKLLACQLQALNDHLSFSYA